MALHVASGGGFAFDAPLLAWFRQLRSPLLDAVFLPITALGYAWGVIPASVLLVLVLLGLRRWRAAAFAATAMLGTAALNQTLKHGLDRSRPDPALAHVLEHSPAFPSAHAMGSMALACVVIWLAWPTRWRWPVAAGMLLFALLVGVSRMYLGVHHPSDVLAGWLAATAWVALVARVAGMVPAPRAHDDAASGQPRR